MFTCMNCHSNHRLWAVIRYVVVQRPMFVCFVRISKKRPFTKNYQSTIEHRRQCRWRRSRCWRYDRRTANRSRNRWWWWCELRCRWWATQTSSNWRLQLFVYIGNVEKENKIVGFGVLVDIIPTRRHVVLQPQPHRHPTLFLLFV